MMDSKLAVVFLQLHGTAKLAPLMRTEERMVMMVMRSMTLLGYLIEQSRKVRGRHNGATFHAETAIREG